MVFLNLKNETMKRKVLQYIADGIIKRMESIPLNNDSSFERWFNLGMEFNKICTGLDIYLD